MGAARFLKLGRGCTVVRCLVRESRAECTSEMEPKPRFTALFEKPPIVELALSVQFAPLTKLRVAHLGLLWRRLKEEFPNTEEHPPLLRSLDPLESRPAEFQWHVTTGVEVPRVWFLNEDGSQVIQVQPDRFAHNWRREEKKDATYPSFVALRDSFTAKLRTFVEFVDAEKLGSVEVDRCEITYVDHVPIGALPPHAGALGTLLGFWDPHYRDPSLGEPDSASCELGYRMTNDRGEPSGRIQLAVRPGRRRSDGKSVFVMQTTGHGPPLGRGVDGVLAFLDRCHDAILRLFLTVTRRELHEMWGRKT